MHRHAICENSTGSNTSIAANFQALAQKPVALA